MCRFLNKISRKEEIPEEWRDLPKEGDTTHCKNLRLRVRFLTIAKKVQERTVNKLHGFCHERSCTYQIATLRLLRIEQPLEWSTGLYLVFIDFEKTLDSVDRNVMWQILCYYGVPGKIADMTDASIAGLSVR